MAFRAVLAVCVCLVGCGDDAPAPVVDAYVPTTPDAIPPARVEHRALALEPGRSAEARLDVPFGDAAHLVFVATGGDVAWDVHRHGDSDTTVLMEGEAAAVDETYRATSPGDVHVSWTNLTAGAISVDVTLGLFGDAMLIEWYL